MASALLLRASSRSAAVRCLARSTSTMADKPVAVALQDVAGRMAAAVERAGRAGQEVRLVAVSKTKPVEALQEAYDAGQRVFGENYVQEMLDKAPLLPKDVAWHFIGHLQSNKVKAVVENVPNLAMVETVDSPKLADRLNRAVEQAGRAEPLPVMVQVNTSGEESKYGVQPDQCVGLAKHIVQNCPKLRLAGLMTIGMPDYSSRPECFTCLATCRAEVAAGLGWPLERLELSMGMSGDFEQAIEMGSTNIRVGSTIFGAREYPTRPKSPPPSEQ